MEEVKRNWYALKVFYGKVFEIEALLQDMDLETYIPVRKELLKDEDHMRALRRLSTPDDRRCDNQFIQAGPLIFKRIPVVSSLLFVRAPQERIGEIGKCIEGKGFVYKTADRKAEAVIPDKQMAIFQLVCSSGAEGYIKRIRKDRRLLVAIEGFIAVATTFIPPQFLEKVSD